MLTLGLTSFSQITISNTDFPSGGDTVLISGSSQFNLVNLVPTGANQTWDFSFLQANTQTIDTFFLPPNIFSTYGLVFSNPVSPDYNSDYYSKLTGGAVPEVPGGVITINDPVFFTKNSPTKSEIVGLGMEINGVKVPAKADSIDMVYQLPMTFNDNWFSRSYIYLDLNPAFNGIFKRHQTRSSIVDGWGQITTPMGTFDAVRVVSTVNYIDSVYFELVPGVGAWNELPTPIDVEYTWWTNNNKTPVLKVITQEGVPTTIDYRDHVVTDFTSIENTQELSFNVYPNPAKDVVVVTGVNTGNSIIEVLDITGKVIYSLVGESNPSIDVSSWKTGIYLIKVINNSKVSTKKLIIE